MPQTDDASRVADLIGRWRDDPGGTYRSWFLWDERLKNFRSIRRGITQVVKEMEHTTSIYSGIVRMLDLAYGGGAAAAQALFLVAPDDREEDVRAQLQRPAFRRIADLRVRYLRYSDLAAHRDAMGRFGQGLKPVEALARNLH